jgi:acetyltransferase-like isoleucine patch superfamily enzyme
MDLRDLEGKWDYGTLPANVSVGENCFIERKESFTRYRSTQPVGLALGTNVTVYMWTAFTIDPGGTVTVGDDTILVGAIIMCAGKISIGRRVVVSYHVTIADSDFHPVNVAARRQDAIASAPGADPAQRAAVESRPIDIGDDVWIGIGAYILKGVRIGNGARILAGSVVTRDVAPGTTVAGNPARPVEESRQ